MTAGRWSLRAALGIGERPELVAFVGGGGKTSLMFALAAELPGRTVVTTTTRIFAAQMKLAPAVVFADDLSRLDEILATHGCCLVVGRVEGEKAFGVDPHLPASLLARPDVDFVLVEADGSRMRPIKAPAGHEPVIPPETTLLVPVAGIDALDGPLDIVAHRPEKIREITNDELRITNYFLIVSRLVAYKKIDLAIRVFNELGLPLVVVGTGRDEVKLKKMAKSNIVFVHDLTDESLSCYYENSLGFVMLQEEDFGLSAVEAQLHGVPVLAYAKGGALDTVIDGKTGILFNKQTEAEVKSAILKFRKMNFRREDCIENAERFGKERFKKKFMEHVTHNMEHLKTRI